MCRADGKYCISQNLLHGSPPRVRGRPNLVEYLIYGIRFTPACAGQTGKQPFSVDAISVHPRVCGADFSACGGTVGLTVHPRVCGADVLPAVEFQHVRGSPPRVRGRHRVVWLVIRRRRFTPACAGQTSLNASMVSSIAVHPRVCGADDALRSVFGGGLGSPPRVRGRPNNHDRAPVSRRFTPACAGQTCSLPPSSIPTTVHPRVCGADEVPTTNQHLRGGSPPRVQGRRSSRGMDNNTARFTPACAGQTLRRALRAHRHAVHPRVCGADDEVTGRNPGDFGSPPRVRGRRHARQDGATVLRFTPACAGQTQHQPNHDLLLIGSPPRVRGRRYLTCVSIYIHRFTPACAGQTLPLQVNQISPSVHPRVCGADL